MKVLPNFERSELAQKLFQIITKGGIHVIKVPPHFERSELAPKLFQISQKDLFTQ
jgi:hypothetical protein